MVQIIGVFLIIISKTFKECNSRDATDCKIVLSLPTAKIIRALHVQSAYLEEPASTLTVTRRVLVKNRSATLMLSTNWRYLVTTR